jgi:hypothetical protein
MIRLNHGGQSFCIKVFHSNPAHVPKKISAQVLSVKDEKPFTEVKILHEVGNGQYDVIAEHRAQCGGGDSFFRAFGRRWAFEAAVAKVEGRDLRTALWTAYNKACHDGPTVMAKLQFERAIAASRLKRRMLIEAEHGNG